MKKRVAVIFGGEGAERAISEKSAAALIRLIPDEFELIRIGIDGQGGWYILSDAVCELENARWQADINLLTPTYPIRILGESGFYSNGKIIPVDVAFPILHGDFGEDGIIQGALRCAHIPYVGSETAASAISADKAYTKIIAEHLGIRTAPWFIPTGNMRSARKEAEARLGYPVFIKPRRLGSSIGAGAAHNSREFARAYEAAAELCSSDLMIEAKIEISKELEFALYDGCERFISGAGAINSAGEFYDYAKKYENESSPTTEINAKLDRRVLRSARTAARRLADFLRLGNLSRVDFFLTPSGELIFNEINSIPGMTQTSLYPALVASVIGNDRFPSELLTSERLQ